MDNPIVLPFHHVTQQSNDHMRPRSELVEVVTVTKIIIFSLVFYLCTILVQIIYVSFANCAILERKRPDRPK